MTPTVLYEIRRQATDDVLGSWGDGVIFAQADACRLPFADGAFSLVIGSPPYADARTYGIGAQRKCQAWIDWMLTVTAEAVRVSRGLVLWVCAGVTRKHCYWPGPEGLLYEWWRRGGHCWRPAYWHRVGIPGSGGKQWLRADVECVLAFTGCTAALPWADNTANGHPPKWAPGGEFSYRDAHGKRRNDDDLCGKRDQWGGTTEEARSGGEGRNADGSRKTRQPGPNRRANGVKKTTRRCTRGKSGGDTIQKTEYVPPVVANPGTLIRGIHVGGGLMGNKLANLNEAPYPEKLAAWFIRGWAEPGSWVLDPFSGSGTTVAAAVKLGRKAVGCDLRLSQCQLGQRRTADIQPEMLFA